MPEPTTDLPIAIFHEHPDWFRPLFAELDRREVRWLALDAAAHWYDPRETAAGYSLVVNRASPSAYLRDNAQATFHTLDWLRHLHRLGVPVVNGADAYAVEISKALQLSILEELGLQFPATRVVNHPSRILEAAHRLRYPLVVKANIGGSGAGITRFDSRQELADAVASGALDLGRTGTALVQELAPLASGRITRVEVLDRKFLYAIHVYPTGESFNLCPADVCQTTDGRALERTFCAADAPRTGMRVEQAEVPAGVIAAVETIAERVGLDVGGIEFLVDERDGSVRYYDINALSNFVADAPNVIGFDPFARLADYLERRAGMVAPAKAGA